MGKVSIRALIPNMADATSLYRASGPLAAIKNVETVLCDTWNWATIRPNDIVFMQRPYNSQHLQITELVKSNRKPLWVDYDDDLFSVPKWNPTHEQYTDENVLRNVAKIVQMADVVTVTTEHLKKKLEPLNKNVRVVPNALDMELLGYRKIDKQRNSLIFWRGSATHEKDLMVYTPAMCEVVRVNPKFTWSFMGKPFWWTLEQLPEQTTISVKAVDPIEYYKLLHDVAPAIMQVPLLDCDFNRSKSNIAWLEAAFAGALTLGPDWEEWRKPGVLTYKNHQQYVDALSALVRGEIDINGQCDLAWEYIRDTLTLDKVNPAREKIIGELLECKSA